MLLFTLAILALFALATVAPKLVRLRIRFFKWIHWTWAVRVARRAFREMGPRHPYRSAWAGGSAVLIRCCERVVVATETPQLLTKRRVKTFNDLFIFP